MAISQFVPVLRIGYLYTYWGPLGFVISVTMIREAIDDFRRFKRDREVNSSKYVKLCGEKGQVSVSSSDLKVGDIIYVEKGQRVPADMILLRTTEHSGSCFIRTDQLDGETDWKLRLAIPSTQKRKVPNSDEDFFNIEASIYAEKPQKDIHSFIGKFISYEANETQEPLTIENTLWSNTVVASGTALGVVIYTGSECRAVMNNSKPRSKIGLLDLELNDLTKILFLATAVLSVLMVCLKGFEGPWYIYLFRFILLFSYLIPISLRVNIDMGKIFYSWQMQNDKDLPGMIILISRRIYLCFLPVKMKKTTKINLSGTVARSTTIPEELGRVAYLLSDKTGTLTKNQMIFKKLHLGTVSYNDDTFDEGRNLVNETARHSIVAHRLWEENLGNVIAVIVTDSFGFVTRSLQFYCPSFIPKEKIAIQNYSFLR